MKIFGIHIDNLSKKQVLHFLHDAMHEERFHRVATVNPEFLLAAEENHLFKTNLLTADLRLPDGVGITWAAGLQGETLADRLPGADLLRSVLTMAAAHHFSVYMALRRDGLSSFEAVKRSIEKQFGTLQIEGQEFDLSFGLPTLPETAAQILLCNFGAPEQEFFVAEAGASHPTLRLGMGVGGAFDFLTGKVKRAPEWMRYFGLEWLWRVIEQPQRLPRTLRAVFLFPWRVFTEKSA